LHLDAQVAGLRTVGARASPDPIAGANAGASIRGDGARPAMV
jgi:hypothetical protein